MIGHERPPSSGETTVTERRGAHRMRTLMPDGTVKALVAALLDHLDAIGIPTVVPNDRIEGKHYGDLIDVLGHFAREVTPDGVAVSSPDYAPRWL